MGRKPKGASALGKRDPDVIVAQLAAQRQIVSLCAADRLCNELADD
jgi:hypothetical protein